MNREDHDEMRIKDTDVTNMLLKFPSNLNFVSVFNLKNTNEECLHLWFRKEKQKIPDGKSNHMSKINNRQRHG